MKASKADLEEGYFLRHTATVADTEDCPRGSPGEVTPETHRGAQEEGTRIAPASKWLGYSVRARRRAMKAVVREKYSLRGTAKLWVHEIEQGRD